MVRSSHLVLLLGVAVVFSAILASATTQFTPEGLEAAQNLVNQKPARHFSDIPTIDADVPFIRCAVCKRMVRQLLITAAAKKTKPSELDYVEWMKNVCDPLEDEGFWITHLDIVEDKKGKKLDIKRMSGPGHCEEDCKTIGQACKSIVDAAESDIAEVMYLNKTGKNTPEYLCQLSALSSLKGSCGTTYPPLSAVRAFPGQEFRIKTKADFEREQKMAEKLLYGDSVGSPPPATAEEAAPKEKKNNAIVDFNKVGIRLDSGEELGSMNEVMKDMEEKKMKQKQKADEL